MPECTEPAAQVSRKTIRGNIDLSSNIFYFLTCDEQPSKATNLRQCLPLQCAAACLLPAIASTCSLYMGLFNYKTIQRPKQKNCIV